MEPARVLRPHEVTEAANVLARAFTDDPLWVWLIPDTMQREPLLGAFFRPLVKLASARGLGYAAGEPTQGVAIWSRPGVPLYDVGAVLRAGYLRLVFSRFGALLWRARTVFRQFGRMHAAYASGPHYYLDTVGVSPVAQGQGLASALIRPLLAEADVRNLPAYTGTMTPHNVTLYQHYGFEIAEAYAVPNTGLTIWSFVRPPAVASSAVAAARIDRPLSPGAVSPGAVSPGPRDPA